VALHSSKLPVCTLDVKVMKIRKGRRPGQSVATGGTTTKLCTTCAPTRDPTLDYSMRAGAEEHVHIEGGSSAQVAMRREEKHTSIFLQVAACLDVKLRRTLGGLQVNVDLANVSTAAKRESVCVGMWAGQPWDLPWEEAGFVGRWPHEPPPCKEKVARRSRTQIEVAMRGPG
jgi:hypothetical protein